MNILEGIKSNQVPSPTPLQTQKQPSTKFIIKSKPSIKQNKQQFENQHNTDSSSSTLYATNQDIHQLITYIIAKSKRLAELMETKAIDTTVFYPKYLFDNPCVRTYLKAVLDRMLAERRLGKALKGINKSILTEIQNYIWPTLERQTALYELEKMYQSQKSNLQRQLETRREQIRRQLEQLSTKQLQEGLVEETN